jgi:hypothetical protein
MALAMHMQSIGFGNCIFEGTLFLDIIYRMSSQGRLAEILGEKALDLDKFIRNLGYLPSAHRIA